MAHTKCSRLKSRESNESYIPLATRTTPSGYLFNIMRSDNFRAVSTDEPHFCRLPSLKATTFHPSTAQFFQWRFFPTARQGR